MPRKSSNGNERKNGAGNGTAKPPDRPVVYPELCVNGVPIPRDKLRVTDEIMKTLMGWESEADYATRLTAENPELAKTPEKLKFPAPGEKGKEHGTGVEVVFPGPLLTDEYGHKVVCHNNLANRDFHESDARSYAQEVLEQMWKLNGETLIIGDRGSALSIQHRGAGLILACQMWEKDPAAYPQWKERPWIETLVVTGVDEGYETVQTLDNGVPRTLADTLATGRVFDDWKLDNKALTREKRSEAAKLVDYSIDMAWRRTGAAFKTAHQTHSASRDFLNRHPGLIRACKHIFEKNQDRGIGSLKIVGAPALCYLMSVSGTEEEAAKKYFASDAPTDTDLDFSALDKAEEFWSMVATKDKDIAPLFLVLNGITDGDYGTVQLMDKRTAAVVNCWNQWSAGSRVSKESIQPDLIIVGGEKKLDPEKLPTVGGIDLGARPKEDPNEPQISEEEAEANKEADRAARAAELDAARTGVGQGRGPVAEAVASCRKAAPGRVLLFATSDGGHTAFDEDADAVCSVLGGKPKDRPDGLRMVKVPAKTDLDGLAVNLRIKGHKVTRVTDEGKTLTDLVANPPPAKPKAAPAPTAPKAKGQANGTQVKPPAKKTPAHLDLKGGL